MPVWNNLRGSIIWTAQLVLGLSIITNIAMLGVPIYTLQIFDRVLLSSSSQTLWMLFSGMVVIALTALAFEHLRRKSLHDLAIHLGANIYPAIMENFDPVDARHKNELSYACQDSLNQLRNGSLLTIIDSCWSPLFIVVTFFIHPVIGIFMLIINVLFFCIAWYKYQYQIPNDRIAQNEFRKKQNEILFGINSSSWLENNGFKGNWYDLKIAEWQTKMQLMKGLDSVNIILHNLHQSNRWLAQIGIPTCGAVLLLANEITTGGFLAALIIGSRTLIPVESLILNIAGIRKCLLTLQSAKDLLIRQSDPHGSYNGVLSGEIKIINAVTDMNFCPRNIINDSNEKMGISFNVNAGEITALIGETGARQHDIIHAVLGYTAIKSGRVLIDNIRVEDWCPEYLKKNTGFSSASSELPVATIESLITGFGSIPVSQAINTAERTGLNKKMIQWNLNYSDIYQPEWSTSTTGMSLRQLISLTATIAKDAQLLVLDLPETCLDFESLTRLAMILAEEKAAGKTVLITTQSRRLSQQADQIVVLTGDKVECRKNIPGLPGDRDVSQLDFAANNSKTRSA